MMATRKTPSAGAKPDKLMRDAILLELNIDAPDPLREGRKIKKLRLVARALVDRAINGDVPAIKGINDRSDGKLVSAHRGGSGAGDGLTLEDLIHMSYGAGRAAP